MAEQKINPESLQEIRLWAGYKTVDQLAYFLDDKKLNRQGWIEKLIQFEVGDALPQGWQLKEIVKNCFVDPIFFELENLQLPQYSKNFRRKGGVILSDFENDEKEIAGRSKSSSQNYHRFLCESDLKKKFVREFLQEYGYAPCPIVKTFQPTQNLSDDVLQLVSRMKQNFPLLENLHEYETKIASKDKLIDKLKIVKDFFDDFKRECGKQGVLVFISSNDDHRRIDIKHFRGVAISDPIAPLIGINYNDYIKAQVFTLLHELAHLYLGASNLAVWGFPSSHQESYVEDLCDQVAEEILYPKQKFLKDFPQGTIENVKKLNELCKELSRNKMCSSGVVVYRAFHLGKVNEKIVREYFSGKYIYQAAKEAKEAQDKTNQDKKEKTGKELYYPPPYPKLANRGEFYAKTVVDAYRSGYLMNVAAMRLLNIKKTHDFMKISEEALNF